jgi:hypothetical protein
MKAQDLLRHCSLFEAISVCLPFKDEPDMMIMLIRLAGLVGSPIGQHKLWSAHKLDAIQYLSLGHFWLADALRWWDFDTTSEMLQCTSTFSMKGKTTLLGNVAAAVNNFNFKGVEACALLRRQFERHPMNHAAIVIGMWLALIRKQAELTPMKQEKMLNREQFAALEDIRDESVIPLYFDDQNLRDLMHPSILRTIRAFSCVVRSLLALKFKPDDVDDVLNEITELGSPWTGFVSFVRSQEIEPNDQADVYVLGSIAMAAKLMNLVEKVRPVIAAELQAAAQRLEAEMRIDQMTEFFASYWEDQAKRIGSAADTVLKFME